MANNTIIPLLALGFFMGSVKDNIGKIREIIEKKKAISGIRNEIRIIAVTKSQPADTVKEAILNGFPDIGENRVQEAEKKFQELRGLTFTRHLIGHLQENKANKAAVLFDMIQSIDNLDTAAKLDKKLKESGKSIPVLVEVNTSGDKSKFGIRPDMAEEFIGKLKNFSSLMINGLMTIGPFDKPVSETRICFKKLFELKLKLSSVYPDIDWKHLSMGMSDDFEIAIEEGSNMLRLGRILFGERKSITL